mgnify:CR=1 FL=1
MLTPKRNAHLNPRCSITKLGEYCSQQSSPARRRDIVKSQKFPPTFKVVRYTPATRFIIDSLVDGYDQDNWQKQIDQFSLQKQLAVSTHDQQQAGCSADALRAFQKVMDKLPLADCDLHCGPKSWALDIEGVTVSIRPELFLNIEGRNGVPQVGCIKLYFSKTHRLDAHAAGVISSVIIEKMKQSMPTTKIASKHIYVVDVFGETVFSAPPSHKKLFNEAVAACQEMAFSWPRYTAS